MHDVNNPPWAHEYSLVLPSHRRRPEEVAEPQFSALESEVEKRRKRIEAWRQVKGLLIEEWMDVARYMSDYGSACLNKMTLE